MFWNILKNDIVRGMFKRKYLYIIPIEKSSSVFYNLDRHILLIFPCVDTHTGCAGICGYSFCAALFLSSYGSCRYL